MIFVKLAWRNIFRNYRRSAITITAITVGVAALIFFWGYVDGVNNQMIENSTRYLSGHLQVHQKGYHKEQTLDLAFGDADLLRARLLQESSVEAVTFRLEGEALISGAEKSRGVLVIGVDPREEPKVTTLSMAVKAGAFLSSGEPNTILLGDKTAEILRVGVGEEAVLVTQAADGSIGAGRYRVKGIFDTGIDMIDGTYVLLPLEAAQDLYALRERVTALAARLNSRPAASETAARLSRKLGPFYEVLDWQGLLPSVVQAVELHEIFTYIILLVVFVVVAVGIANTILMAVMERTREFGVMMALGTTHAQILRLILHEAALLGIVGLAFGNLIGISIVLYFAQHGMDLGRYVRGMETMPGLSGFVYPLLRADHLLIVSAVVFVTGLFAAFYPAWKASRLKPVEAIRGIERTVRVARGFQPKRKTAGPAGFVFLKIARRSVARNPRRSALTVSAVTIGLAAFLFLYALADGFFEQMVKNSTGYITGHLQIQHKNFREEMDPALSIERPDALLARVRQDPRVSATALRVQAQAMVSSPVKSEGILLFGVDPASEPKVTILHRAVKEGSYLRPGNDREILLGRKLVEKLGVALGEKVVVVAQSADGTLGSAAFRVGGIFETESEAFDGSMGFVGLKAAQTILSLGQKATAIVITLRDRNEADRAASSMRGILSETPYEAFTWKELLPEVVQMIELARMNIYVVLMIVFAVVALGVMNTILMSVMERTREFGIMMALGTRPSHILKLIVYESAILGSIGMVAGYAIGVSLTDYIGSRGLDLTAYTGRTVTLPGLTGIIYPELILGHVLIPSLVLFLTSLAAALYPAWRAARLDPVRAIRYV